MPCTLTCAPEAPLAPGAPLAPSAPFVGPTVTEPCEQTTWKPLGGANGKTFGVKAPEQAAEATDIQFTVACDPSEPLAPLES